MVLSNNNIDKIKKGKHYEKLLRKNATPMERKFKKLLNQVRQQYGVKFRVFFQKGWYKDQAFFISDFYFPVTKKTIEIDGSQHNTTDQSKRDKIKSVYLKSIGIVTVRLTNFQVKSMDVKKAFDFLVKHHII